MHDDRAAPCCTAVRARRACPVAEPRIRNVVPAGASAQRAGPLRPGERSVPWTGRSHSVRRRLPAFCTVLPAEAYKSLRLPTLQGGGGAPRRSARRPHGLSRRCRNARKCRCRKPGKAWSGRRQMSGIYRKCPGMPVPEARKSPDRTAANVRDLPEMSGNVRECRCRARSSAGVARGCYASGALSPASFGGRSGSRPCGKSCKTTTSSSPTRNIFT